MADCHIPRRKHKRRFVERTHVLYVHALPNREIFDTTAALCASSNTWPARRLRLRRNRTRSPEWQGAIRLAWSKRHIAAGRMMMMDVQVLDAVGCPAS
jgi:hypothetical protein